MKFIKETGESGVRVSPAALALSGLDTAGQLELHILDGAVLLLKDGMTAKEVLSVMESLSQLSTKLILHMVAVCGQCGGCEGDCPFGTEELCFEGVPSGPMEMLTQCDICLGALNAALAGEEIVYGGKGQISAAGIR